MNHEHDTENTPASSLKVETHNEAWHTDLPEDIQDFARSFANPESLLRSHQELQKHLSEAVMLPGPDASPEEISRFYAHLGVPEHPDDYGKRADSLADSTANALEDSFLKAAHRAHLSRDQVAALRQWLEGAMDDHHHAQAAEKEQHIQAGQAALQRLWGHQAERQLELARSAVSTFGEEGWSQWFDEKGLGNDPQMIAFLARIGLALAEDDPISTESASPQGAKERLEALHTLPPEKYYSDHVQREVQALYQQIYEKSS